MIQHTRAIALHSIKYQDTSLIAHCYTEEMGRVSVLVQGAFGTGRRPGQASMFQPFSVLNLLVHRSQRSTLHRLKEAELHLHPASIPFDPQKRCIALFLSEVIYKVVREEEPDPALFGFIVRYIAQLDAQSDGVANSHLGFMGQLIGRIGFGPLNGWTEQAPYLDCRSGMFVPMRPAHGLHFEPEQSRLLGLVLAPASGPPLHLGLSGAQRRQIMDGLLQYLRFHLGDRLEIGSLPVLSSIFR
ncbi:MAG: DNA repair protein RecO [Bacteroidales bacterium]|nr:DNA repair protein RecO [Bacteroidales bacterium]